LADNKVNVAFWNIQNLFDTTSSDFALDFEFTPANGYDETVRNIKIDNLVKIFSSMFEDGIDLIGLCEIENEFLAQEIVNRLNVTMGEDLLKVAKYEDSPDIRAIDTCLIYSSKVFDFIESKAFNIHLRYPTRDLYYVKLRAKQNNSDLHVFVNHWPSRRGKDDFTESDDTEFARCVVAENCGKIIDDILKIPRSESRLLPDCIIDCDTRDNINDPVDDFVSDQEKDQQKEEIITKIETKWNENILLMGDFNDEPYNKSLMKYLYSTPNKELLRDWKTIWRLIRKDPLNKKKDKEIYIEEKPALFNCMWNLIPDGSHFFYKTNSLFLFDQFIVSKGLFEARKNLEIDLDSVEIYKEGISLGSNLEDEEFDIRANYNNNQKPHPILKSSPMNFLYSYQKVDKKDMLPKDIFFDNNVRTPNTGYSDHFPIKCVIKIV
jgi:hypothetical protein